MPPSLRKACHPCAAAKRRCIPELPQCLRCIERRLSCTYDLEPVTNKQSDTVNHAVPHVRRVFPSAWEPLPLIVFDSVASAHQAAVESYTGLRFDNLPVMASEETLELVVDRFLRPMPSLIFHQRTTPHVHSQILLGGSHVTPTPARSDLEPQASLEPSVLKRTHQQLVYLDINSLSLTEFLAAFHGLVAILLATILSLNHQSRNPSPPTDLLDLWSKWRQQLSVKLPRELDSNLSAWQAWYMAETARRSLLCVILIDGILEVVEKGYCSYRPMVESMPFDARTGLWEADTEQDWLTALSQHGGEESSLISWAEFIEAGDIEPRPKYDGMLQRMLLAIHYGKAAADLQDTKNCAS